jgi:hypothetical protein
VALLECGAITGVLRSMLTQLQRFFVAPPGVSALGAALEVSSAPRAAAALKADVEKASAGSWWHGALGPSPGGGPWHAVRTTAGVL